MSGLAVLYLERQVHTTENRRGALVRRNGKTTRDLV